MFLTNAQAKLITAQPDLKGIQQLLQALEMPQPKLVINLLPSWGFAGSACLSCHVPLSLLTVLPAHSAGPRDFIFTGGMPLLLFAITRHLGKAFLLPLTTAQALLCSSGIPCSQAHYSRQSLHTPPPEYSASGPKFKDGVPKDSVMGMVHGKSPFTTVDEGTAARARLDTFMIDVIIPIAVKTSALIVCEATAQVPTGGRTPAHANNDTHMHHTHTHTHTPHSSPRCETCLISLQNLDRRGTGAVDGCVRDHVITEGCKDSPALLSSPGFGQQRRKEPAMRGGARGESLSCMQAPTQSPSAPLVVECRNDCSNR